MNSRLVRIIAVLIFLFGLAFIAIFVDNNQLSKERSLRPPNLISSYQDTGYLKIDPETILTKLIDGNADIFMPLLVDPQDITEDVTDITIRWTQADFLEIASALGQYIWDDPMQLKDWNVYSISFGGRCDEPVGFIFASITYFKTESTIYVTRLIEIEPYLGWVGWGDGATYPKPVLQKWDNVDLLGAKITAEDALRIASEDAKNRFQFTDNCGVLMSTPINNDPENWHLKFFGAPDFIDYIVNFDTGDFTFRKINE